MTFSLEQAITLIAQKTGGVANNFAPCILNAKDLKTISEQELQTQPFYFGTVQCVDINEGGTDAGLTFKNSLSSKPISLAINKYGSLNGYRSYENVLFDSIEGTILEDNEIIFSGIQFDLIIQ